MIIVIQKLSFEKFSISHVERGIAGTNPKHIYNSGMNNNSLKVLIDILYLLL